MAALTLKQEAFTLAYIETGNASEAYRRAYNAGNMKPEVISVKASELLKNGKVAVKVAELRGDLAERHEMTVGDIARMLREDREFARKMKMPGPAVSATMGLAKLYGHLKERVEHSGPDGGPIEHKAAARAEVDELFGPTPHEITRNG